jgi:hypothetical protein
MVSALVCVALLSLPPRELAKSAPATVTPLLALRGGKCEMKSAGAYFATSAKEFQTVNEKLGLKVNGKPVVIDIDYTKCFVVVLCSGEADNLDYTTYKLTEHEGAILIRYQNRHVGSAASCVDSYSPFAILVIARAQRKRVMIEQNVQFSGDEPPVWERRATFGITSENRN